MSSEWLHVSFYSKSMQLHLIRMLLLPEPLLHCLMQNCNLFADRTEPLQSISFRHSKQTSPFVMNWGEVRVALHAVCQFLQIQICRSYSEE